MRASIISKHLPSKKMTSLTPPPRRLLYLICESLERTIKTFIEKAVLNLDGHLCHRSHAVIGEQEHPSVIRYPKVQ